MASTQSHEEHVADHSGCAAYHSPRRGVATKNAPDQSTHIGNGDVQEKISKAIEDGVACDVVRSSELNENLQIWDCLLLVDDRSGIVDVTLVDFIASPSNKL
jgi:hypothetical protein